MLLVCYNFPNSQNIPISNSERKEIGYYDTFDVAKKADISQEK